jgi:hypothetical protein
MTKLQILTHLRSRLDDLSYEFIWPDKLKEISGFVYAQLDQAVSEACASALDEDPESTDHLWSLWESIPPGSSLTLHRGPEA